MRVTPFAPVALRYGTLLHTSLHYFPFSYEALFFALKVQYNLAQGSASLKLRITNDELRMAGFCFSHCKGNTQQPNVKRWAKPIKNGHDPKVMPVIIDYQCFLFGRGMPRPYS